MEKVSTAKAGTSQKLLLIDSSKQKDKCRPLVRIFSDQNKKAFLSNLQLFDWNSVYEADDAHTAYNSFLLP